MENEKNKNIEVRDIRDGRFLWMDKDALEYVSRRAGASGSLVYMWLCYYANNKSQDSWPSIPTIQKNTGLGRMTVIRAIQALSGCGAIAIKKSTGGHNVYTLLEIQQDLFHEEVPKGDQYQNGTGTISRGTSTTPIQYEQDNKSNKTIKRQPSAVFDGLPYEKPTKEQLKELDEVCASVYARFPDIYKFIGMVKKSKGYPPPPDVMITVSQNFLKTNGEVKSPWAYFTKGVREGSCRFFADLNIKMNKKWERAPACLADIMRGIGNGKSEPK